ncbi:hypothetical protein KAT59_03705 [Candidatus Bipolaricaulota bacterium]|nr:hypothetical protein [Candidatus Bipolaricaulota bacterium]
MDTSGDVSSNATQIVPQGNSILKEKRDIQSFSVMFVTARHEYGNSFKAATLRRIHGDGLPWIASAQIGVLTYAIIFALTGLTEADRDMLKQLAG